MDHVNILKRAWQILWNYRALWIFGIILALTTFSWQSAAWARGDGSRIPEGEGIWININEDLSIRLPGEGLAIDLTEDEGLSIKIKSGDAWKKIANIGELVEEVAPPNILNAIFTILVGLIVATAILYIIAKIAHYVVEAAIIQMVSDYESDGKMRSIRQGVRLGWSRTAWKLFLIDLVIILPAALLVVLLFGFVLAPLLLWTTQDAVAGVIGTLASAGLFFPFLAIVIVIAALLAVLLRFFHRACVLEELGVRASMRQGFEVVSSHLKDVGVMWVIMLTLGFVWTIAMIPLTLVLVPILLVLIIAGVVVGGILAGVVAAITSLFIQGIVPWILGGLVGLPIFILVVASPMIFLSGLWHTYRSASWTLTYRELRGLEVAQPETLPELAPSTA